MTRRIFTPSAAAGTAGGPFGGDPSAGAAAVGTPFDDDQVEEPSPAARFARSRDRAAHPHLQEFLLRRPFRLDGFQLQACRALDEGDGVLVCAPTGAGKTVVGEFAVHRALATGRRCFYTTPIKALSNQKYADLVAEYGADRVGLLTGDTSVNPHAPAVVMTTEVLRNMLYAHTDDRLDDLAAVVLDEVHYLADRFRGAVWEEVILHLPAHVQVVGLSATVSNAEEFGAWLQTVRGRTAVVVDEVRPVPLWQHMMVGRRLFDLFSTSDGEAGAGGSGAAARIDPALTRAVAQASAGAGDRPSGGARAGRARGVSGPVRWRPPARVDVIERLDAAGLLPAITFVFSRAGCDAAVAQCVRSGLRLTTDAERVRIEAVVDRRTAHLPDGDLDVLGYWEWREGLGRGLAAHHAGLLPVFKETVEELFVAGLIKVVFATETLALGINMPARTVVLEKLVKFNGEGHADLTPGEYTQLTGRAGRRGIDVEGHAVVLFSPGMDPRAVGGLASKRTFPLRSSFRPGYNMAVNLLDRMGRAEATALLEQSFAQYQADASVVEQVRRVRRNTEALAAHEKSMRCHLGSTAEYLELLGELSAAERRAARTGAARRREAAAEDLLALRRGDVVHIDSGRRSGYAVVLDPGAAADGLPHPLVLTDGAWAGRVAGQEFRGPVPVLGRLTLARRVEHRSPQVRKDVAAALRSAVQDGRVHPATGPARAPGDGDAALAVLRRAVRSHPVHGCADRESHLQWARRWQRLAGENVALEHKVEGARGSLGGQLDRVIGLLARRGFVTGTTGPAVTPAGRLLARIWSESDLLVAESVRSGLWADLGPAELAAVVSVTVFQARRDVVTPPGAAAGRVGTAIAGTHRLWAGIAAQEHDAGLPLTREPDAGFAVPLLVWARGGSLGEVLAAALTGGIELSAGDFVRWCRQVIDVLEQIGAVAGIVDADGRSGVRVGSATAAVAAIRRGVVALGAG